ncbi:MAG: alpha/beta hydrolase [Bacteroidota bacterium]
MAFRQIQKEDHDPELQEFHKAGMFLAGIMQKTWKVRLFNSVVINMLRLTKRKGVVTEHAKVKSTHGGPDIPVLIYKPLKAEGPLPIMLYIHGGGYITGSPEMSPGIEKFIEKRPCIIVAPRYRKALTAPYPAALDDCYDTLLWIKEKGEETGGMNDNIMVAGHSAGGGLTAAVTLKNRDHKDINIAFQIPIYPMIDHRSETESAKMCMDVPFWNTKANYNGWGSYLKGLNEKNQEIPAYAAPALNKDYTNFPPTISFVGEYDAFRDENIEYIEDLDKAGIPTRFKVFPKAFHGFELLGGKSKVAVEGRKFLFDAYKEFYDMSYS